MQKTSFQICPRCKTSFVCNADNITACQCYGVSLTEQERVYISGTYTNCLCRKCLEEIHNQAPDNLPGNIAGADADKA
ncbi:cysteine-rich CWC family protein [Chitinophagaceae bacterium MMS25-I14]